MVLNSPFAVKFLVLNVLYWDTSTRVNIMAPYVLDFIYLLFLSNVNFEYSVPSSPKSSGFQKTLFLILHSENIVTTVNNQEKYR